MKNIYWALLVLCSQPALAATNTFDIKMNVAVEGKQAFAPRLIVAEGALGSISSKTDTDEQFVDVVASSSGENGVKMIFKVGTVGKNGERKVLAEPQIIALLGEQAKIELNQNGKTLSKLSLSVIVKKSKM